MMAGRHHIANLVASKKAKRDLKLESIKLKQHHAKAYRKRHVSALFLFIILSSVFITWLLIYQEQVRYNVNSASNFISDVFNPATNNRQNINSTYGFSLGYDSQTFNASAIDTASGGLFVGQELSTNRAYQTVKISTGVSGVSSNSQRSLTLNYYDNQTATSLTDSNLTRLETEAANSGIDSSKASVSVISSNMTTIGGVYFKFTEWGVKPKQNGVASKATVEFRTYAGVVNGKVMVIKITYGLSSGENRNIFKPVIESMKFGARTQAFLPLKKQKVASIASSHSLLNSLLLTKTASAESLSIDNTEQVSSRYSPAVVKVYNVYCMDINIDGKLFGSDICQGNTGSGFFIDAIGNIATNGHVVSADPLDIVIQNAVEDLINGDQTDFNFLAGIAGVKDSDFKGNETIEQIVDFAVNKMYAIDPSRIVAVNNVDNLLVGLNGKQPDIAELVQVTKNRKVYAEQDSVIKAKLVAKDYRVIDGITSYKASDVAIIKLDTGKNYPVAKLGSLIGVSQGAGLTILGFPGEASDNGLVDSKISVPTLTAGKVSAIKTVTGSTKKLIETDATIGHGNSGGPVFDNSGDIIGIATYTIDGSGSGDGVFNYIRDIQDLKDLAAINGIKINGTSQTQTEWDKGIDLFYKAHYSKAMKSFAKVKQLYPEHPKADEMITASIARIQNGQDVKDFPYLLVGASTLSVIGIGVSIILILRHRRAHKAYKVRVANHKHVQPEEAEEHKEETHYKKPDEEQLATTSRQDPPASEDYRPPHLVQ